MGVPFVMSLTTMRTWLGERLVWRATRILARETRERHGCCLRLSALGTECEVLWFLLVGRTLLTLRRAFYLEDLLPGCWGDQGSCELVSWF